MLNFILYSLIVLILTIILFGCIIIRFKNTQDKNKIRPFECGYDPIGSSRIHFCMKFFLVAVIFLIFDVEVRLILPLPFGQLSLLVFLVVLILGLMYE